MRKPPRPRFWLALVAAVLIATAAHYPEIAALLKSIFPGKTKWDYLEKIFIPVFPPALVAAGIWWLNKRETARQEKRAEDQRESEVVTEFLELMTPLILEKGLCQAIKEEPVVAVGRSLIIATLSRLRSEAAPRRRTTIMRYMFDAGVTNQAGIFDLQDANLSEADLSRANLIRAYLSRADLSGANLSRANLSRANLSGANLIGATLSRATLVEATLGEAYLIEANLIEASLIEAFLVGANLIRANLIRAKLSRANLIRAKLSRANLSGSNLSGAYLSGADLSGANLSRADLSGANLSEADLSEAIWDEGTKWPVLDNFKDAQNIPPELKKQLGLP
jgi:uncharacterized protein YjbI with pentapeptide repeats